MTKMVLKSSDTQATSVQGVMANRMEGYRSAVLALSSFNETTELSSVAYDSGKSYGMGVLVPLMQGFVMLLENVSEGTTALPKKYRSEVWHSDLDSATLESDIAKCQSSLKSLRGAFRLLDSSDDRDSELCTKIETRIYQLADEERDLQDKLNKLIAFNNNSNSVFGDLEAVATAMEMGINQIRLEFSNFDGEFHLPIGEQANWINTLNNAWAKRAKSMEETRNEAVKKVKESLKSAAYDALESGVITETEYKSMIAQIDEAAKEFLKHPVGQFVDEMFKSSVQDYISDKSADFIIRRILPNSPEIALKLKAHIGNALIKYGLAASIQSSGTPMSSAVSSALNATDELATAAANGLDEAGNIGSALSESSKFSKYLPSVIGGLIDFGLQLKDGENVGDAAVKAITHTIIGMAVGATSLTTLPALIITVGLGMAFDWVYNTYKDDVVKGFNDFKDSAAKKIGEIGDAVGGFFSDLGSAFS